MKLALFPFYLFSLLFVFASKFNMAYMPSKKPKGYGYTSKEPIKVGGVREGIGPASERAYLNKLAGPKGEAIWYSRVGSCCPFKTSNGFLNNSGMLDVYKVTYQGNTDTVELYLNMYDYEEQKLPKGFSWKQ